MEAELMKVEQVEKVRAELAPILAAAQALTVTDEASFGTAMELGADCARRSKHIEEVFKPAREATHRAWKAVTETIASFVNPLDAARKLVTDKGKAWKRIEDAKRQAEADEAQRLVQAQAEEARLRAAVQLESTGRQALADAVLAEPVKSPVVRAVAVVQPKGTSVRENWQAEVVDLAALVKAVAEGKCGLGFVQANDSALRLWAKMTRGKEQIPGVRVWDEGTVAFRGR
jgi:hypothetical protein